MTSSQYLDRSGCCPFDSEYSILVTKDSYVATLDGRTRELPQCEVGKISEGCKQRRVVHSKLLELSRSGPKPYRLSAQAHPLDPATFHLGNPSSSQEALLQYYLGT